MMVTVFIAVGVKDKKLYAVSPLMDFPFIATKTDIYSVRVSDEVADEVREMMLLAKREEAFKLLKRVSQSFTHVGNQ